MNVLHLNTSESGGGASKIARQLCEFLQNNAINSSFLVKKKTSNVSYIHQLHSRNFFSQIATKIFSRLFREMGLEFFPTRQSKRVQSFLTDDTVIHLHNIHCNFLDIQYFSELSHDYPTIITLHDTWYYTGHCAHHFDCYQWKSGCRVCKYLNTPPNILRDNASANQRYKLKALSKSNAVLVSPSNWLLNELESIPELSHLKKVLIPNGVDPSSFSNSTASQSISLKDLENKPFVVTCVATNLDKNPFKYFSLTLESVSKASKVSGLPILFNCVGCNNQSYIDGLLSVNFIPFSSEGDLAKLMQSSDLFIHLAKGETFGLVIVEAMLSGLAVIASDVGGIPDIVVDGFNGYLVENNVCCVSEKLVTLMMNPNLLHKLATNAKQSVRKYTLASMCDKYLSLYKSFNLQ